MKKRKLTGFELVWYLGVFGFLLVWFTQIHPLVVYDADDWTYLAYVRSATPIWGDWNPAKVFPETVMPFFSTVAVYTLMPLLGDYILAQTVMHALVVSAFITVYVFCFTELVKYPGFPNQYQRHDVPGIDSGKPGPEDLRGDQPGHY